MEFAFLELLMEPKMLTANNISYSKFKYKFRHFSNIDFHCQWLKLFTVSICCRVIMFVTLS